MQVHNVTWCREYNVLYFNSLTCISCNIGESCSHFYLGHIKMHNSSTPPTSGQDIGIETQSSKSTVMPTDKYIDMTGQSLLKTVKCSESDVKPNDWIAVFFTNFWYPGLVLANL
ncbi:unnamed protein product [Psylliodes chrysocephalus]|uniref:Uncharacterized protein n=1 Tax=Psylliodes chrysocephalus TaxID=3402493 RepID=A0A9P0CRN3_9CUCU|nr:unnamed protein product [Psylliodes chrysocephala]